MVHNPSINRNKKVKLERSKLVDRYLDALLLFGGLLGGLRLAGHLLLGGTLLDGLAALGSALLAGFLRCHGGK